MGSAASATFKSSDKTELDEKPRHDTATATKAAGFKIDILISFLLRSMFSYF